MCPHSSEPPGRRGNQQPNPMVLMGAGVELGGVVVLMALAGWWLDKKFQTSPWLMLTAVLVGIVGGIYNLWKQGKRFFN